MGTDYIIEHHPEVLELARFGIRESLLRYMTVMRPDDPECPVNWLIDEIEAFRPVDAQFRSEDVSTHKGITEMNIGIKDGWALYLHYYVSGERYYFIGFSICSYEIGG